VIRTVISDMGNVILPFDVSVFLERIAKYSSLEKEEIMSMPVLYDGLIESFGKGRISPNKYYKGMKEIFKVDLKFKDFLDIYCDIFSLDSSVLETLAKIIPSLQAHHRLPNYPSCRRRYPFCLPPGLVSRRYCPRRTVPRCRD